MPPLRAMHSNVSNALDRTESKVNTALYSERCSHLLEASMYQKIPADERFPRSAIFWAHAKDGCGQLSAPTPHPRHLGSPGPGGSGARRNVAQGSDDRRHMWWARRSPARPKPSTTRSSGPQARSRPMSSWSAPRARPPAIRTSRRSWAGSRRRWEPARASPMSWPISARAARWCRITGTPP